jgi:competence protein ComEC
VAAGPLVALAGLVAGILAGEARGPAASGVVLAGGAVVLVAAWFVEGRLRVVIVAIALAALGCATTQRALDGQRHSPLRRAIATRTVVTADAVAIEDPDGKPYLTSLLVRVRVEPGARARIVLASASGDGAGRLRVLHAGDRVVLRGRLEPLRDSRFEQSLRWRHAVGRLDDAEVVALRGPVGVHALADRLRDVVVRGTGSLPATTRALLTGFLLGDTRGVPDDVEIAYRDSGLSHLLVVSGGNVAFTLALVGPLLRRLPLGGRTAAALAVVVVFAAMTRFEPSVLRASAMATVAVFAAWLGRPTESTRLLVLAVIALLLADPFLFHSMGFRLSVAASAGIVWFARPIAARLPGPAALRESLGVSLAAQVGVTPLLLGAFGTVPLVTPLANLLAAPAAELLGVYGLLASAAAGVVPAVGPLVQQPCALLVAWVTAIARAGAAVPLQVDAHGAFGLVAVGGVLGACSLAFARGRRGVPDHPSR